LSNENSKLYTNEKSSYLTNNTVPSGGPLPNCGLFSSFYWAAQHSLWAVFAAPVAWAQTLATATTISIEHWLFDVNTALMLSL